MKLNVEKVALGTLAHNEVSAIMSELQAEADMTAKGKGAAVGAVSIQNGKQYRGYNTPGLNDVCDCHTHAEVMSLALLRDDFSVDTDGSVMITTRSPCLYCAAHIISAGVAALYAPPLRENSKWYSSQVFARYAMRAVGIKLVTVESDGVRG